MGIEGHGGATLPVENIDRSKKGSPTKRSPRKTTGIVSTHFSPSPKKQRPPRGTISVIKVPLISDDTFGLIQEELAHDPFKLLLAVTLLNRTRGSMAIPQFRAIVSRWPNPSRLSLAPRSELLPILQPTGLQNRRIETLLRIAKVWETDPPCKGRRFRTLNYPFQGAGKDVKAEEILDDEDTRTGALEIANIKGLARYAWDSWRIFCRDELREVACGFNGEGTDTSGLSDTFEPEWKRVQPMDKELRAFLKWMWLKEGISWDPETCEKRVASDEEMARAEIGEIEDVGGEGEIEQYVRVEENYLVPLGE